MDFYFIRTHGVEQRTRLIESIKKQITKRNENTGI